MPAPANDTRATAQVVTVGSYWGVVTDGTTVDATEDAGGPVDGFDAQDVFYTWSSLPAGNVFVFIQPKAPYGPGGSDTYFEAAAFSGAPTDWTSAEGLSGGFGFGGAGSGTCRFQHLHTGGALTLVVYTYNPDAFEFDFGWGHDLDPVSAHWGADQTESWTLRQNGVTTYIGGGLPVAGSRYGTNRAHARVSGTSVPAGHPACTYDNARDGVTYYPPSPGTLGCSDLGTDTGGTSSDLGGVPNFGADVGQVWSAAATALIFPVQTSRVDESTVAQQVWAFRLSDNARGPITEDGVTPPGFGAYQTANEGPDDALVWGYDYTADEWETRNFHFLSAEWVNDASVADEEQSCTIHLRPITQSMVWDTEATVSAAQDRVYLDDSGVGGNFTPGWVSADSAASLTALVATPSTGAFDIDFADPADFEPYLVHASGGADRWLVFAVMADETINDEAPNFTDPPRGGSYVIIGNRLYDTPSGATNASFESRVPPWRPYIGFELVVPPVTTGWRIGRVGAGSTPW